MQFLVKFSSFIAPHFGTNKKPRKSAPKSSESLVRQRLNEIDGRLYIHTYKEMRAVNLVRYQTRRIIKNRLNKILRIMNNEQDPERLQRMLTALKEQTESVLNTKLKLGDISKKQNHIREKERLINAFREVESAIQERINSLNTHYQNLWDKLGLPCALKKMGT